MVNLRTSGKSMLLMLVISHIAAHLEGHHWRKDMNPGMMLQVHRDDSTIVQKYFTHFLPRVADTALGERPNHYQFTIQDPLWNMIGIDTFDTRVEWTDIQYQDHEVRLDQIKFKLEDYNGHGVFWLDFPAYKNIVIMAHQRLVHWLFGGDSAITIDIKDFDMDFKGILKLDQHGYLDPVVFSCDINFGESDITSSSWLMEALIFEVVHFSFIVIHNAAWVTGPVMFTQIIGPVIDKYLNHYQMDIAVQSPIAGLDDVSETFTVDYRNTHDPIHEENSVLFKFMGEFFFQHQACKVWSPTDIPRLYIQESYLALSTTAVECMAEQFTKTKLSTFELNEESLDKLFGSIGNTLTTTSLAGTLPILETKLGKNKPLNFVLGYKDMKVDFDRWLNPQDYNFRLSFTLLMGIHYRTKGQQNGLIVDLPQKELMYDEIQFVIEGSAQNGPRTTYAHLTKFQLDHRHGNRHQPFRNSLDLTKNEYLEFLSGLGVQMKKNKNFLNSVLNRGIVYPFNVPEFHTFMFFERGAAYFIYTHREYTKEEQQEFWKEKENEIQ